VIQCRSNLPNQFKLAPVFGRAYCFSRLSATRKLCEAERQARILQAFYVGTPPEETARELRTTVKQVKRTETRLIKRLGIIESPPKRQTYPYTQEDYQ
jgi:hypothetical protein